MGSIEIHDDEIKSEEILEKIRENIRKRKESGSYPDSNPEILSKNTQEVVLKKSDTLSRDLEYLTANYEVYNKSYFISSHRPLVGRFLIKGRKMVNDEVKRYIDPVFAKQTEINACNARISAELIRKNSELNLKIEEVVLKISDMNTKIEELNSAILSESNNKNTIKTPWGEYYSEDISENDLGGNINYHKHFISLIEEYAQKASNGCVPKLLEVGLGTATMSIYFSRQKYDVLGIDNDINVIYNAINTNERLGGYAKFIVMDANNLDLMKNSYYNVAFSQGTLEHFGNESIICMLSKQLEVAKYVVFSVPSINYPKREFGNERKMTIEDWEIILKAGGFNIVRLEYYREDTQIACVIQKKG